MLTLNKKHRGWVILAVLAWIVILFALIFLPLSRATGGMHTIPTNSLQQSLLKSSPAKGDAMVAQMLDPSLVYDTNAYAGFITLCPTEPKQLQADKIEQLGIDPNEVDLGGDYGYVVLLPASGSEVGLDKVDLKVVNVCTMSLNQPFPLNASMPFRLEDGTWTLWANAQ